MIGDVLKVGNGKDYKHLAEGDIPVFGTGGYMLSVNDFLYDGDSVFIGRKGTINKPFFYSGKFWTVDTLFYTHSFNKVIPHFVYGLFQRVNWNNYNEASGVPSLSKSTIEKIPIAIPSIEEQQKISSLLSLLDQRIETQKKIIEDLKKLKDAINNSLHNNINEFQLFSFNELGNDYSGLTGKSSDDFGSGLPYISYLNVFRNDIVTDGQFDCVKVSKTEKQNVVSYGDLLFTLSSETHSEVGIGAIYLGKTNPIYLNSFCFGVHLSNHENIYGPYLAYFVTSQYFRRTILPFAQGSTRYNLMKGDFMKHKFRFPAMAMQKEIYNALYTLSEKIRNEETGLNKYAKLKQYLLTQMFI